MFFGALLACIYFKANRKSAERYNLAIASGLIAGESLIAVTVALLVAANVLVAH